MNTEFFMYVNLPLPHLLSTQRDQQVPPPLLSRVCYIHQMTAKDGFGGNAAQLFFSTHLH